MDARVPRRWQIHLIPVPALRKCVAELLPQEVDDEELIRRFKEELKVTTRTPRDAIKKLTRQQANKLIAASPEIPRDGLEELYEQYRYGMNPSIRVFVFDIEQSGTHALDAEELTQAFANYFANLDDADESWPSFRRLRLNPNIESRAENPDVLEGTYRYSQLLEYISECEVAQATYETKYGYFWINASLGYVAIHGSNEKVVRAIRDAFEETIEAGLVGILFTKHYRKRLSFLKRHTIYSSHLYNVDPSTDSPEAITVKDPKLHSKSLGDLEQQYSGKKDESYKVDVDDELTAPIVVKQNGTFRLKGKVASDSFRDFSMRALEEIMRIWVEFAQTPESLLATVNLESCQEYKDLGSRKKRDYVRTLVSTLLTAQRESGDIILNPSFSPLDFARTFGQDVFIRIPYSCNVSSCQEDGYHKCDCGSMSFRVTRGSNWLVKCANPDHSKRGKSLPVKGMCEHWHPYEIDVTEIEDDVEVILESGFKEQLANLMCRIPGIGLDLVNEKFHIKGRSLVYEKGSASSDDDNASTSGRTNIHVEGDLNYAENVQANRLSQGKGNVSFPENE